jgi:uncharacterized protein
VWNSKILGILFPLLFCSISWGTTWEVSKPIPSLTKPVVDEASLLSAKEERALDQYLSSVYQQAGIQIAVFTTASLEGEVLEQYSLAVAEKWGLGKKETDKGLLLLIAKKERKIRIEVGQGLEGDIPDAKANYIIQAVLKPAFRKAAFGAGIHNAINAIVESAAPNLIKTHHRKIDKEKREESPLFNLFKFVMFLIIYFIFFSRGGLGLLGLAGIAHSSGRYRGGGGSFGGGFSGGGGGFSGGGASGGW